MLLPLGHTQALLEQGLEARYMRYGRVRSAIVCSDAGFAGAGLRCWWRGKGVQRGYLTGRNTHQYLHIVDTNEYCALFGTQCDLREHLQLLRIAGEVELA
jgi:hypothetical protein